MKIPFLLGFILAAGQLFAEDQTPFFEVLYQSPEILNEKDIQSLRKKEIILIPCIVSETFYWQDDRSVLDFAFIFKNYFGSQHKHYKSLNVQVTRLWGSSKSVDETISEISSKMKDVIAENKKAIFITHSLGGLALLDWLVNESEQTRSFVEGIVFIQSPFYGSPAASIYFENPYHARTLLGPIMPFFNASEETVKYLSVAEREAKMEKYEELLPEVLKNISVITAGGTAFNSKSIFRPSLNVMEKGCLVFIKEKCRSKNLYEGPFSDSDGMVPFENSKLPGHDHVELKNVDHGETVLNMPFQDIDNVKMTDALLKIILKDNL